LSDNNTGGSTNHAASQVRLDGQQSAQQYTRAHDNTTQMHQHQLNKHNTGPTGTKFNRVGAISASGTGVADVEVDVDHLTASHQQLTGRVDRFTDSYQKSEGLAHALPAGHGPTADMMNQLFSHRLGVDGGIRYAMNHHLNTLSQVTDNLNTTIGNYNNAEQQALSNLAIQAWEAQNPAPAPQPLIQPGPAEGGAQ
jgi:hypothetical protein